MFRLITIARPYAKAAFDFACKKKLVEEWKFMLSFVVQVISIKDIRIIIMGSLGTKISTEIFLKLCENHIDKYFMNFLKIIIENKRLHLFKHIYYQFIMLLNISNKITKIEIITSKKLNTKKLCEINTILQKRFINKIELKNKLNTELIGGTILKLENYVIDDSICLHLKKLKNFLKS